MKKLRILFVALFSVSLLSFVACQHDAASDDSGVGGSSTGNQAQQEVVQAEEEIAQPEQEVAQAEQEVAQAEQEVAQAEQNNAQSNEMVTYSNSNILQQAGQSMLAQANQSNQNVLSLLGNRKSK